MSRVRSAQTFAISFYVACSQSVTLLILPSKQKIVILNAFYKVSLAIPAHALVKQNSSVDNCA